MHYTNVILLGLAALTAAAPQSTIPDEWKANYGITQSYFEPHDAALVARNAELDYPQDERELATRSLDKIPLKPITWIGALQVGGPNVSITGSHHFVKDKLTDLGAHWLQNNATHPGGKHANGTNLSVRDLGAAEEDHLEKRGRTAYYCNNGNYNKASCQDIQTGQWWIGYHFGNGLCAAGPNACGRFSCIGSAAILMCSSAGQAIVPCSTLSMNANFVYNNCFYFKQNTYMIQSQCTSEGQAFYENPNYNVLEKGVDAGNACPR